MQKVVCITGGNKGIGAATAQVFSAHGYDVILNYKTDTKSALDIKNTLEKEYKVKVLLCQADVSNEEEVCKMFTKIKEEFLTIDCLVNNAGIAQDDLWTQKSGESFSSVTNVNLKGTFLVTKYASFLLKKSSASSVINVSSNNALDCYETYSMDYDASKAGILSLTHNFAQALAPIRVNAVAPGWICTSSVLKMNPNELKRKSNECLLNRLGEPEEVAQAIYFLASENASFINDTILRIDGGVKKHGNFESNREES